MLAYHDKHKSLPATAQLIGRLARADDAFPQPSVVVTARDADVYPELRGVLKQLYQDEDPDWIRILPGIIDDEVADQQADVNYSRTFGTAPPFLSLASTNPLRRVIAYESTDPAYEAPFRRERRVPEGLRVGSLFRGTRILYSGIDDTAKHLLLVTQYMSRPPWHAHPGLDSSGYDLHIVSFYQSQIAGAPSLVLFNSGDGGAIRDIRQLIDPGDVLRIADPIRFGEAFDSLNRTSVSSVGVRNTYAGRGIPTYQIFSGSDVDHGIREGDVPFGALGHAIVQTDGGVAAGFSARKAKFWETRYAPLRYYDQFAREFAMRYWSPPASVAGQLLPMLARGARLDHWPLAPTIVVDLDVTLVGSQWLIEGTSPVESAALESVTVLGPPAGMTDERAIGKLPILLTLPNGRTWRALIDAAGTVEPVDQDLTVTRGWADTLPLSELLSLWPPTIFFQDGTMVRGHQVFESRSTKTGLPPITLVPDPWTGVDITAETRATATAHARGQSVDEYIEAYLLARPRIGRHRWLLHNDGQGEIADYILLEYDVSTVHVELWHVKASGARTPAVRVTDLQEVIAQAIKSRRWIVDRGLWSELGARLEGRRLPTLTVLDGSQRQLEALLGLHRRWNSRPLSARTPLVDGEVWVAQPGLSAGTLRANLALATPDMASLQSRDLLSVMYDAVSRVAAVRIACSA